MTDISDNAHDERTLDRGREMVTDGDAPRPRASELASLVTRLQHRHPGVPPRLVGRSIDEAISRFSSATVHDYLVILIERTASESLDAWSRTTLGAEGSGTHPWTGLAP